MRSMLFVVFLLIVSSTVIESRSLVKSLPGLAGDLPFKLETGQMRSMLFVVFLLIVSSTVIESRSPVKSLPGLAGDLPFKLETGYIGVGESDEVQLFYYFFESEGNPKEDPLIFWLLGGPGCSGLSSIVYEIGPFTFDYANFTPEKPILEIKPHSWTKAANIIFIDQPAGAGFSYARNPEIYNTSDTLSSMKSYQFLRKWLIENPEFLNNPLYVGSESYMGIVLPLIVQDIYNGNEAGEEPQLNLKGYLLGNPLTNRSGDYSSRIPFAHQMALLSDEIYMSANENCGGVYLNVDPNNTACLRSLEIVDKCIGKICMSQILEPYCEIIRNTLNSDLSRRGLGAFDKTFFDNSSLPQVGKPWCGEDNYLYSPVWANRRDVREALHVREETADIEWVRCNATMLFKIEGGESLSYTHDVVNTVDYHRRFTHKNCRALIISGDHDMVVPYLGTLNWIKSLNLSVIDDWRPWFVDEQVAGYTMKYLKDDYTLTFATVKGGGHNAPEYKPKESLNLLMRWLADETL